MANTEETNNKGNGASNGTIPRVRKDETLVLRMAERLRKMIDKFGKRYKSDELNKELKAADLALRQAVATLSAMPDEAGYVQGTPKLKLEPGVRVAIREKFHSKYEGLLEGDDLIDLEVVKVSKGKGGQIIVKTADEQKIFLARGQIIVNPPAEA